MVCPQNGSAVLKGSIVVSHQRLVAAGVYHVSESGRAFWPFGPLQLLLPLAAVCSQHAGDGAHSSGQNGKKGNRGNLVCSAQE